MVFPIIQYLEESGEEFLADFISYNVAQQKNPGATKTREYIRYEKINDGDTVHLFDLSQLSAVTGLVSAHIINTTTNFTFPNKDVRNSQESSPTPQFKRINSSALSLLHSPTLTSIHDHRKNHSLD